MKSNELFTFDQNLIDSYMNFKCNTQRNVQKPTKSDLENGSLDTGGQNCLEFIDILFLKGLRDD